METRTGWGTVIVAGTFALVVIGVVVGAYMHEKQSSGGRLVTSASNNPDDADNDGLMTWEELVWHTDPKNPDTDADGVSDGDEVSAHTDPTIIGIGVDAYAEWGGSTPTEEFISNIAIAEKSLTATNASFETTATTITALADGLRRPDFEEKIPLNALNTRASTSIEAYGALTFAILKHSVNVREHELATFSKTVTKGNVSGTPALKKAARVYKQIEAALIVMEIPQEIAVEHLALVNSVGSLANIVNAMAVWSGDPVAGLAYTDTFLATEYAVDTSVAAVLSRISVLLKKT